MSRTSTSPSRLAVSVVLPALNAASTLLQQLEALDTQADAPAFEVLVVDNGSTDTTSLIAQRYTPSSFELRVIPAPDERGASYARNVGARFASAELLMFCDSDDVVSRYWISHGLRNFSVSDVWSGEVVPMPSRGFAGGTSAVRRALKDDSSWHPPGTRDPADAPTLRGGNFGITRELFFGLDGFDQSMPSSFEDLDLAYRVRERRIDLYFASATRIAYRIRDSRDEISARQVRMARAQVLVACRHNAWADVPYAPWPILVSHLAAATLRMPFRRRVDRDWRGLRERVLFTWGVSSGTIRYRYLRLIPPRRLAVGLYPYTRNPRTQT